MAGRDTWDNKGITTRALELTASQNRFRWSDPPNHRTLRCGLIEPYH